MKIKAKNFEVLAGGGSINPPTGYARAKQVACDSSKCTGSGLTQVIDIRTGEVIREYKSGKPVYTSPEYK